MKRTLLCIIVIALTLCITADARAGKWPVIASQDFSEVMHDYETKCRAAKSADLPEAERKARLVQLARACVFRLRAVHDYASSNDDDAEVLAAEQEIARLRKWLAEHAPRKHSLPALPDKARRPLDPSLVQGMSFAATDTGALVSDAGMSWAAWVFSGKRWMHVVRTWKQGTLNTYIDGTLDGTEQLPIRLPPQAIPYRLMQLNEVARLRAFEGTMDRVSAWKRALTPDEIVALYQGRG